MEASKIQAVAITVSNSDLIKLSTQLVNVGNLPINIFKAKKKNKIW